MPIPTPYPLCVGLTHDFFIEWTNFDVPTDFAGIDGKPAAHVIINATPARDVPAVPCLDAIGLSTIALNGTTAIEYRCPPDSPRIERLARHGEGAYAGHVTLTWTHDAIRYLVSSHSYGTASKHLAEDLARALSFVQS